MLPNNLSHISSLQRNPTCPKCNGFYVTKEHNRQHRNPLILDCGHTFCEGCLTKMARETKTSIPCPTCKAVTPLPQGEASVKNLWPDVYVTGWMLCQQRALLNQELEKLSPAGIVQNPGFRSASDKGEREKMCRECFRRLAMCRCDKCDVIMCHGCFEKVHSKSNTLKQHQALPIESEDSLKGELTQDCPLHEGRELEYYCEDDKMPICSKCVIFGNHKGHVITSMEEKNKTVFSEMEPALHLANKVVRKLIKVDKTMTDFFPDAKVETAAVIFEIREHFQELHGLLQAREKQLIDEVFAAYKEGVEPLENLRHQMQDERMKLEVAIRAAQRVLNNNNEVTLNAKQILDRLNQAKEIPCIILPKETETTEKISFIENDSFVTSILSHGKVVGKSQVRATWHTLSEMPAEIMNDDDSVGSRTPVDTVSVVSTPYSQESEEVIIEAELYFADEENCSVVGGVETGRRRSREPPGSYPQAGQQLSAPRCRIRGKNEFVSVTHIINPCKFMVQLKEDQPTLRKLSKQINLWANTSGANEIPTEVKPGDLVIVKYTQDDDWYRGRVKQVLGKNNVNKMQLEVLYIDYGNSEIVGLERVRKMQTRFQNHPEFMVECSLFDIIPPDTGGWSKEATQHFCKMTENKTLYMTVIREVNNVLHVDLSKPALDMTKNEVPISIRDALVFLEFAQFVTPDSGNITGKPAVMRQYIKPEPHYEGEIFNVIVTSVTDPHNFYIQELGDVSTYFAEMMNKMQKVYSKENSMDLWSIYCPKKDMVCSCQYSLDKVFYRAIITNLPGRKQVDVFYVDFGNRERVHYSRLRILLDEFLILPAQAVKCRLVDVEPKDSKSWSDSAKQWWTMKVNLNKFTVKIAEVTDNKVYSVVLMNDFDEDKPQYSLNSELVSKGYANSTGDRSLPIPEDQFLAAGSQESLTDSSTRSSSMVLGRESTSVSTESLPSSALSFTPGASPRKLCSPAPEENVSDSSTGARKKSRQSSSQKKKSKVQKSSEEDLDVEVKIGHFTDPSCFYAYVVDESLNRIMDNMEEEYHDSEPQWINWDEGTFCAARRPEDRKWYRARIEQVIHKNLVEVFLVDFGFKETIQTSELRSLRKDFSQDAAFSFLCHLAEVVPAGDQSTWSRTACEFMLEETQDKKLYIKKKGEKVEMSAPVDLILETDVPESALEPSRKSYTSLIEMMKDRGLVIPTPGALSRKKTPVKVQPKTYPIMFYDSPILPEDSSFIGIPVYVNFDAVIFVQEVRQDEEFKDMSEVIQKRFMDSEPHKYEEMNWQLNQACIAYFHLDEHWYRAKILSLEPHRVKVKFVDFGNCENLSYDKIRADVQDFMYLPPQCFECVLYNILPNSDSGKWPKKVLDYMHKLCVTKACVIDVMEDRVEGEPLKVKIMLPDHQDFASVLEMEGLAVKEDSLLELMLHSQEIEKVLKTNNPYKSMPSFSPGEYFTVLITHVEVPNVVYYQHTRYSGDEADERTDEINEQLTRLEQMWVELNEAGPVAPPLKRPRPGMMCCAQFAVDQCWYRGLVITSPDHQSQVLVLYVDFGTSEIVTLDRVRSLPQQFHSLPAQANRLTLTGIQLPPGHSSWSRQAQEEMLRVVGAQVAQCCLKNLDPLEGELFFTEDWNNVKIVYQELIDNGILHYSEETDLYDEALSLDDVLEAEDDVVIEEEEEEEDSQSDNEKVPPNLIAEDDAALEDVQIEE
ncbi:RING finger protein 17-like isoform X2 [Saccostrea echinata]|uniref:RING finger protein 17-like isoform X2 n=1 Tax=Saccostrea echinata TaxID=191078 RepID=UPI002A7F7E0C|nr:RING finger protein 17-like isoform X2 [Saccostrea echinata]